MRVSPKMYIHPPSPGLHCKELLLVSDFRALVQFHSVILELHFTPLTLAHDAETDREIGIIRVYLELII